MGYLKRHWIAVLCGLIFLSFASPGWPCPFTLPTVQANVNGHVLTVELATTPETRSCGLSHRESLPKNQGMLFVYADPEILTFWMKDTHIPLSIAFIDADGRIVSIQKMIPLQITPDHMNRPYRRSMPWKSTRGGSKKTASVSAMSSNSTCRSR